MSDKFKEFIKKSVKDSPPELPCYFLDINRVKENFKKFNKNFKSDIFKTKIVYSVKSNPLEDVLIELFSCGIDNFDIASISEARLIDDLFEFKPYSHFMHPVKTRKSIKEAYFNYNIRTFALDSEEELCKILEETNYAKDLNLIVRISTIENNSKINLSKKFGINFNIEDLLIKTKNNSKKLGISFHVGSQCMNPEDYINALNKVKFLIKKSNIKLDILDIGGGFPGNYEGMNPLSIDNYLNKIFETLESEDFPIDSDCEIWSEPGRVLVYDCMSLVVRVDLRKGNKLYINDGTYGGLFDAGFPKLIYPTESISLTKKLSDNKSPFSFFGPTCDSIDYMEGPFNLSENINEGDFIEIKNVGAYSHTLRSNFNGYFETEEIRMFY